MAICEYRGATRISISDLEQSLRVCIQNRCMKLPHVVYMNYLEASGSITSSIPRTEAFSDEDDDSSIASIDCVHDDVSSCTSYDSNSECDLSMSQLTDTSETIEASPSKPTSVLTMKQVSSWIEHVCTAMHYENYTRQQLLWLNHSDEHGNEIGIDTEPMNEKGNGNGLCVWLGRMVEIAILESWECVGSNW